MKPNNPNAKDTRWMPPVELPSVKPSDYKTVISPHSQPPVRRNASQSKAQ